MLNLCTLYVYIHYRKKKNLYLTFLIKSFVFMNVCVCIIYKFLLLAITVLCFIFSFKKIRQWKKCFMDCLIIN